MYNKSTSIYPYFTKLRTSLFPTRLEIRNNVSFKSIYQTAQHLTKFPKLTDELPIVPNFHDLNKNSQKN